MRRDGDDFITMKNAPGPKRLPWTLETARNVQRRTVGYARLRRCLEHQSEPPGSVFKSAPTIKGLSSSSISI